MGWLTPKCPVDAETQEWIVNSFDWLIEELGIEVLRDVDVLLPIHEHFPEAFDGSNTSIRRMADRICDYMDVDARSIEIRFYRNEDGSSIHPLAASESGQHALGTYRLRKGKYLISLDTSQAGDAPPAGA